MQPGRAIVTIYRRRTPSGNYGFMVANYADGERRRFDSYATEAAIALEVWRQVISTFDRTALSGFDRTTTTGESG